MKKKLALLLVLVMAVSMLGACGGKDEPETEAQTEAQTDAETAEDEDLSNLFGGDEGSNYGPYVQSLLDLDYKGITDTYLELVDDTKENAESFYDQCMEYWAYILANNYQLYVAVQGDETDTMYDEGVHDALVQLTKDIFSHVKYEVADAVKTGDYYTVEVTLYPMLFTDLTKEEITAYQDEFNAATEAGEYGAYGEDEADTMAAEVAYANRVIEILSASTSKIDYDAPVSKIVKITKDEMGYYGISDQDYADLENYLLY